jgi:hypothetical protein
VSLARIIVAQCASSAVFSALTFGPDSVSISPVDDLALVQARQTAIRLARVMEVHEEDLARAAEIKLFPGSVPARVTIATLMRALVATLMDAAQSMAESDAAYNAALRRHNGTEGSATSLVSQDVAEKIALSVELEELVLQHADDAGARLDHKLFPDGLPEQIGMLDIFQALRRRIEVAATQEPAELATLANEDDDLDDPRELLDREVSSVAQLFAELSEICHLRASSRAVRDVVELGAEEDGD